jgi:UDP-glucose 4-epimerase
MGWTMIPELTGEKILIFGGAGSLGTKLCQTFLSKRKNQVYSYSRDEAKQWQLKQLFSQQDRELLTTGICDIRDIRQVESTIFAIKPTIVIIASAMKQVDTCEAFPYESVKTNVDGINNILEIIRKYSDLADQQYTKRLSVCFISTDKACSPVNTYGMCKSIAERLVQNQAVENKKVKYLTVRYGNVVNSKGSIVPLLQEQLKNPGFNLTLTDPRMTRFMMTMEESVELIIQSIYSGSSGDIWIPRLDSMSMSDLFQWFSNKHTRKVEITGIRPGEKIHEVLYNQDESRYIQEFSRGSRAPYYVINKNKLSDIKGFKLHEFSSEHNVISPEVLGKRLEEFFKSGSYLR